MRKRGFFLAGLALLSIGGWAIAQAQVIAAPTVTFAQATQSVPFELYRGNRIFAPARINGRDAEVLLDTGAGATTLDRAYARSIGLPPGRKMEGLGAGGPVEAELVSGVTLEVGGMRFTGLTVAVIDLAPISAALGRPANIILGREFFEAAVVSIDWQANRLEVHSPKAFRAPAAARELKLKRKDSLHTVDVAVAGGAPIRALLDLGNGGNLSLPPTYWAERKDLAALRYAESQAGGVGGLHAARVVLLPSVTLGATQLQSVPATLSSSGNDRDAEKMANVGIGLLKQFHLDLDLGRDRIFLAPRIDAPGFDRDRAGVRLELARDRLRVAFVSPQGPARRAGLKVGDEIVAVDGKPVTTDYYRTSDWSRGAPGRAVELARADGSRVTLTLADYY